MLDASQVIYSDNHLLVVNKPAGIPTQPNESGEVNLEELCKAFIKETAKKPGNVFLHALHRLDKPVSGIVIFAKTSKALSRLNESMRQKETKKVYRALVSPAPLKEAGMLEHYLVQGDHRALVVTATAPQAKYAKLNYKTVKKDVHFSLLEVELETGRYHQIRAQMAAIGCPIIGDRKYGGKESRLVGIALQHCYFEIPHPTTKERLSFAIDKEEWLSSYF